MVSVSAIDVMWSAIVKEPKPSKSALCPKQKGVEGVWASEVIRG